MIPVSTKSGLRPRDQLFLDRHKPPLLVLQIKRGRAKVRLAGRPGRGAWWVPLDKIAGLPWVRSMAAEARNKKPERIRKPESTKSKWWRLHPQAKATKGSAE